MSDTLSPPPILEGPQFKKPKLIDPDVVPTSPETVREPALHPVPVQTNPEEARIAAIERAKKRNRCLVCNKKLGLLPFNCKCGAVTCSTHRGLGHECTFDYRAEARERLRKENPVVAAEKLTRI